MQYAKILTHSCWWSFMFFLCTTTVHAQQTAAISGKVIDANNEAPIEYSSVALYAKKDSSLIAGTLTDNKGLFSLKDLPFGNYYLTVQFIGYSNKTVNNIELDRTDNKIDLTDIALTLNTEMLDAVVVEATGSDMKHSIDKQIYKADQFIAASGGSAIDVLRNMPSVSVNVDGEILMRGAGGFLLLLDGRPVAADATDFLSQLPANSIADIEIITSPSAKYDPDGKSGIINVKTKKGKGDAAYLQVNALLGAPSIETFGNEKTARRFGGDFISNIRKGKWDISLGGDYKRNDNTGYRDGIVRTIIDGVQTKSPSLGERSYRREAYSGRAAMTYAINEWNSLSASVYGGKKSEWRTADLLYEKIQTRQGEDIPFASSSYFNKNMRERRGDFFISSLDYQHIFANKSSLQASALYERTELGGPTDNLNVNPTDHNDVYEQHIMEVFKTYWRVCL
ncbi:TonB-dependent receptor [Sphingobacterium sp. UT-1RO-CII-1]|uniref:TonB-dependent receptor n=1 Tax=Sphingobacterium sp. UT-1RO-CII-1 TaxID=2995225 RepID=UPI00227D0DEC|nr:TonB-dependent receptor [Sphingobacterium sp. UT-1RO-CII-1]MCY4779291.1 TonB-dependent receptor [Sphingobacterium sp. UT-1RO-CII-1]